MRHGPTFGPAIGILVCACACLGASAAPPLLVCPTARSRPTVDGTIEDAEWAGAVVVDRFYDKRTREPAPAPTRVRLVYDAERLYVAASCRFRPGHEIKALCSEDDDAEMWRDDCLELFIDPGRENGPGAQVIVNGGGRLYDRPLRAADGADAAEWDLTPRPQTAARVDDSLEVEIALPFSAFGARPRTGDVWEIKLCRTHWDRSQGDHATRLGDVYTASVQGGGAYDSRPYARLVFGEVTAAARKAMARRDSGRPADVHPYHRLEQVRRTNVWAKPCARLVRDGTNIGERLIFRDTGTGAETWRVTFNSQPDGVSYANQFPWNRDGSLLLFSGRQRVNGYWHMLMSADGTRIWRPPGYGSMVHPRWTHDDPDSVFCSQGRQLFRINVRTGEKAVVAELPEQIAGRLSFGPNGRYAAACKQGFGAGGELAVIDLTTGETRRIPLRTSSADFSGDWLYSGHITLVGKTPHVGYSLNHLPHLSREHQYQQWVMNLETSEYRLVKYLSHGGTSPERDRKVGFSGGGVWTTDWFGDDKRFVMQIGTGGHIAWMSTPEWCVAGTSGSPNSSAFASQLVQVYVDTGNWCRIAYGQTSNTAYASHLFTNTSPDGTKAQYSSTMLAPRNMYWTVMNRPEPPRTVRLTRAGEAVNLTWSPPLRSRELLGYRVWRGRTSGGPYALVSGREPVRGAAWTDRQAPADAPAFYVLTSVEHSTLESRRFSTEVAVGTTQPVAWPGYVLRYVEAETGDATAPLAEDFSGAASCDRFVAHRHGEGEGKLALTFDLPVSGRFSLWGRVRGDGRLALRAGGEAGSVIESAGSAWAWRRATGRLNLERGTRSITLSCADSGYAVDKLLLTNADQVVPTGFGDTDDVAPAAPLGPLATGTTRFDIAIAWAASGESDLHHYQVYRGAEPGFAPDQTSLVGSPSEPELLDWGLRAATTYHYCVSAVDTWGNESEPARLSAQTLPLAQGVRVELEAEAGRAANGEHTVAEDADVSAGRYIVTPPEAVSDSPYRFSLPFTVPCDDRYVVWLSLCPMKDTHVYLRVDVDGKGHSLMYLLNSQQGPVARRLMWHPAHAVNGPTPVLWALTAGEHVLTVSHVGSPGFADRVTALDRIVVTNDLSFVPAGRVWDWD